MFLFLLLEVAHYKNRGGGWVKNYFLPQDLRDKFQLGQTNSETCFLKFISRDHKARECQSMWIVSASIALMTKSME